MHFKIWMISCLDGRVKEKDSMQEWADMMRWTSRKINPKQTLLNIEIKGMVKKK